MHQFEEDASQREELRANVNLFKEFLTWNTSEIVHCRKLKRVLFAFVSEVFEALDYLKEHHAVKNNIFLGLNVEYEAVVCGGLN